MFEGILKAFAGFEFWNRDGWDLNFLVRGLWVDAHTRSACFGHEGTEASDGDLVSIFQGVGHDADKGLDHVFGLFFANANFFGDLVNEFGFVDSVHTKRK